MNSQDTSRAKLLAIDLTTLSGQQMNRDRITAERINCKHVKLLSVSRGDFAFHHNSRITGHNFGFCW
jgi:hypothetical protein